MEKRGGRKNVEKRGECWSVEHSADGSEIIVTFTIMFGVRGKKAVP
jgi:hypothetical protein